MILTSTKAYSQLENSEIFIKDRNKELNESSILSFQQFGIAFNTPIFCKYTLFKDKSTGLHAKFQKGKLIFIFELDIPRISLTKLKQSSAV